MHLQDDSTFKGDILVGADGAYSAVRHQMFEDLKSQGKLTQADLRKSEKGYICLVGTAAALDHVMFPGVGDSKSEGTLLVGDNESPYAVSS